MRPDMAKVIVERPRVGGCGKANIRRNRQKTRQACRVVGDDAYVDSDTFHSMKRVHCRTWDDNKELNENLNPLRRFLKAQVGRLWDDVFSEIMGGLNLANAAQYHVVQHLIERGEVETKTYVERGVIMSASDKPSPVRGLYVHPATGLLCCAEQASRSKREVKGNSDGYCDVNKPLTQWHKVDGIWYEFELREASSEEKGRKAFDHMEVRHRSYKPGWQYTYSDKRMGDSVRYKRVSRDCVRRRGEAWSACVCLFGGAYLPIKKRQMSSKEIRRIEEMIAKRDCNHCRKAA